MKKLVQIIATISFFLSGSVQGEVLTKTTKCGTPSKVAFDHEAILSSNEPYVQGGWAAFDPKEGFLTKEIPTNVKATVGLQVIRPTSGTNIHKEQTEYNFECEVYWQGRTTVLFYGQQGTPNWPHTSFDDRYEFCA